MGLCPYFAHINRLFAFLHSPKKEITLRTEVGAVSGALPPLIGWVAASGEPSSYGWILFGILFTWQLPHFMAIAWNFRKDYQTGGFKLQDLGNPNGFHLARKSLIYTILLTAFVFFPLLYPVKPTQTRCPLFCFCLFVINLHSYTSY